MTCLDTRKRTYAFAVNVIKFLDDLPYDRSTEIMAKQLIRSSTSIGANVVEAKSSSSRRDYINFFNHALKSANETKYWLELLKDTKNYNKETIDKLLLESHEIAKILASSILTLKGRKVL